MNKDARTQAGTSRTLAKTRKPSARKAGKASQAAALSARRTWIVLAGLAGGLGVTGALLTALAPPPLTPDAATALIAVGQEQPIKQVVDEAVAVKAGRWRSIYVHQSLTPAGNTQSLSQTEEGLPDHFLIGNGEALADGAVESSARWTQQVSAGVLPKVKISPDCISICLVGDFNVDQPTAAQQARLLELLSTLQRQLRIPPSHIYLGVRNQQASIAGLGPYFPAEQFRLKLGH